MSDATATPAKQKILLVDDVPANLDVLLQMLEPEGYLVMVATSGDRALKIVVQQRPDLILLDIMMPSGIDGYEVCTRLKADEATEDIPVIFLSALDDTEVKVRAFAVGGVDYIAKPFEAEEVLARVRTQLRLRAMQQEAEEARLEAEAANEAKSKFLACMSHEIRTPLSAMLGAVDMQLDSPLTESASLELSQMIRRNGRHLLSIINDILDLSKVEAGQLQIEHIECSLDAILSDVIALMRIRAADKGIGFEVHLATPIPAFIKSDPTRLRGILLNLMGNAIKFTERGGVRITIRQHVGKVGIPLAVEVEDTGIGMDAEHIANLFQPFQQGDASMSRRFGGTGLGLAISHQVAAALDGEIAVESTPGRGSTFTYTQKLDLPAGTQSLARLSCDAATAELPRASAMIPRRFRGTVLLVEDAPDNQVLIEALLNAAGITVTLAENGRVGMDLATQAWQEDRQYDLILMDMQMPELDGYAATRLLRARGYFGPIVALTAQALAGERWRCLEAGCDDYASKPIDRRELMHIISCYLPHAPEAELATPATTGKGAPITSSMAGDQVMENIIREFIACLPDRLEKIRQAAGKPDSQELIRLVHQLKGAAGGYGFGPVTVQAGRLEQLLKTDGRPEAVTPRLEDLLRMCERLSAG